MHIYIYIYIYAICNTFTPQVMLHNPCITFFSVLGAVQLSMCATIFNYFRGWYERMYYFLTIQQLCIRMQYNLHTKTGRKTRPTMHCCSYLMDYLYSENHNYNLTTLVTIHCCIHPTYHCCYNGNESRQALLECNMEKIALRHG